MDPFRRPWAGYAWALAAVAATTLVGRAMHPRFDLVNIGMVYVLVVAVVALRSTRGPAVVAAAASVATIDYLFVPPHRSLAIDDPQHLVAFGIMVAVALVISQLTADARRKARAQAALELEAETERLRSALLASISHDVRAPLASIVVGATALAERGEAMSPAQRRDIAHAVVERARDMSEHVSKVLQLTRLETGTMKVDRDWASMGEIAASALGKLGARLDAHRLVMDVPPDLPLVRIDAALVEQALLNFLDNAARHTPPGTIVRLRVVRRERDLLVSVEDFGDQLDERQLRTVFVRFPRGRLARAAGGTGLGLAIARAIVRLHGGDAWAERMPDGATAFRFTLALEPMPAAPPEPALA